MNTIPPRVVVYTKDVSNITGLRSRASRRLLATIRANLGKDKSSFITVQEFASYTGIDEGLVRSFLV